MTSNQDRIESEAKTVRAADLVEELKALRKGRGVHKVAIVESVGPSLRAACWIADSAGAAAVRARLVEVLSAHAQRLPSDLRLAVTAAFAMDPQVQQPFLQQRIAWLAERIDRDNRTARRRMCDALIRLAELMSAAAANGSFPVFPAFPARGPVTDPSIGAVVGPAAGAVAARPWSADGWFTEEFGAVVSLDRPSPEAIERRRIVAELDGVERVELAVSLPRTPSDRDVERRLGAQVLYGGSLVIAERASDSLFRYVLELPRPLRAGERHEYAVGFRVPPDQPMRTHYVHTPSRRCDLFDLRVRFPASDIPARVWWVREAFLRVVDDGEPSGEPLVPDGAGDVRLIFKNLRPGFGYGIQWSSSGNVGS